MIFRTASVPFPISTFEEPTPQGLWRELKAINPKYSFSEHVGRLAFRNQADVDRIREGLAKAGLSE